MRAKGWVRKMMKLLVDLVQKWRATVNTYSEKKNRYIEHYNTV
jgi:hypothetical protein